MQRSWCLLSFFVLFSAYFFVSSVKSAPIKEEAIDNWNFEDNEDDGSTFKPWKVFRRPNDASKLNNMQFYVFSGSTPLYNTVPFPLPTSFKAFLYKDALNGSWAVTQTFTVPKSYNSDGSFSRVTFRYSQFLWNFLGSAIIKPSLLTNSTFINQQARVDIIKGDVGNFRTVFSALDENNKPNNTVVYNFFKGGINSTNEDPDANFGPFYTHMIDVTKIPFKPNSVWTLRFSSADNKAFFPWGLQYASLVFESGDFSSGQMIIKDGKMVLKGKGARISPNTIIY